MCVSRSCIDGRDSLREHVLEVDHDGVADLGSYDGSKVPSPLRRLLLRRIRIIRVLFVQGLSRVGSTKGGERKRSKNAVGRHRERHTRVHH